MLDLLLYEELLLQLSVVTVSRLNDQHTLNLAIYQKILRMIYSFVTSSIVTFCFLPTYLSTFFLCIH